MTQSWPWDSEPAVKKKKCIRPRNKVISGKSLLVSKNVVRPKSSRTDNTKTGKHIYTIFGIRPETSLPINCKKLSSLSTELRELVLGSLSLMKMK